MGRNGLGWGIGLHAPELLEEEFFQSDPRIVEGAGKAPVGAFALNIAFGKANKNDPDIEHVTLDYTQINSHIWGVDDVKSQHYNRIVDDRRVENDWDSAEDMQHYVDEGLYEFGLFL